jgi:hypothetical protein
MCCDVDAPLVDATRQWIFLRNASAAISLMSFRDSHAAPPLMPWGASIKRGDGRACAVGGVGTMRLPGSCSEGSTVGPTTAANDGPSTGDRDAIAIMASSRALNMMLSGEFRDGITRVTRASSVAARGESGVFKCRLSDRPPSPCRCSLSGRDDPMAFVVVDAVGPGDPTCQSCSTAVATPACSGPIPVIG